MGSVWGETNSAWRILEKFKCLQKRQTPKTFTFGPTLTPFFPLKMAKSKKITKLEIKFSHRAIQKLKKLKLCFCRLLMKNRITFCTFQAFFFEKHGHGRTLKSRNQNLTYPIAVSQFLSMFQSKKFGPSICQFCGYRSQVSYFFSFNPLFEVWLLFWVPHPYTWQK